MASQNNHVKVVQLLLDYDAEINQQWVRLKLYYRVASQLAYLAAMHVLVIYTAIPQLECISCRAKLALIIKFL